ncbi:MAG: C40 family peptidase [Gemmatimonadales bacterium]
MELEDICRGAPACRKNRRVFSPYRPAPSYERKWGGRTNTGCDCSGFVQAVLAPHGVHLPRDSDQQAEVGPPVSSFSASDAALQPADLIFFAPEGEGITHVAMSTGGMRIIHCSATRGMVMEDDLSAEGELELRLRESIVAAIR